MKTLSEEKKTNIKQLEKRKGRFWLFRQKTPPGMVEPLSQTQTSIRLRNLWVYTMRTIGAFLRETIGERGLLDMFESQAVQYAENERMSDVRADDIARKMIRFYLQPQGIEATYIGDEKEATIVTKKCPLPQKLIDTLEFLQQRTFDEPPLFVDFGAGTLTAKGDWPPKKLESCHTCQIIMPKIGEILGFTWEHGLTDDSYRKCFFKIEVE